MDNSYQIVLHLNLFSDILLVSLIWPGTDQQSYKYYSTSQLQSWIEITLIQTPKTSLRNHLLKAPWPWRPWTLQKVCAAFYFFCSRSSKKGDLLTIRQPSKKCWHWHSVWKSSENVAFEFFNFGVFHQFLSF